MLHKTHTYQKRFFQPFSLRLLLCVSLIASSLILQSQGLQKLSSHHFNVVKVIDGDTFDVTDNDSTFRVRLQGIDAPETGQEFYQESKEFLIELTNHYEITLERKGTDRYGRILANIIRNSDHLNINYEMV